MIFPSLTKKSLLRWQTIVFLYLIMISYSPKGVVIASAGCDLCAETGQCNQAFKNVEQGMFCGKVQNRNCCCPVGYSCNVNQLQCNCHQSNNNNQLIIDNNHHHHSYENDFNFYFGIIPLIIIACCICMCCCSDGNHSHQPSSSHIPFATAVPTQNYSGSYQSMHQHHYHDGDRGGSNIGAALGGLAFGTFLGDMMGRRDIGNNSETIIVENNNYGGIGGNGFFGGRNDGYDIPGDLGGGADGGFDIPGDIGGDDGGFDISGDF